MIEIFIGSILIGLSIGIIGIGGGILLLPFLTYYNYKFQQAVAISLFLNAIPNTLPGLYLYYKNGDFDFNTGIIIAIGTIIGSSVGSYIGVKGYIDIKILYRIYAFILLGTALYMIYYYC